MFDESQWRSVEWGSFLILEPKSVRFTSFLFLVKENIYYWKRPLVFFIRGLRLGIYFTSVDTLCMFGAFKSRKRADQRAVLPLHSMKKEPWPQRLLWRWQQRKLQRQHKWQEIRCREFFLSLVYLSLDSKLLLFDTAGYTKRKFLTIRTLREDTLF